MAKRKLTLDFSREIVDVLRELAERNGTTPAYEVQKAVSIHKFFTDKIDAGYYIVLEREEERAFVNY